MTGATSSIGSGSSPIDQEYILHGESKTPVMQRLFQSIVKTTNESIK